MNNIEANYNILRHLLSLLDTAMSCPNMNRKRRTPHHKHNNKNNQNNAGKMLLLFFYINLVKIATFILINNVSANIANSISGTLRLFSDIPAAVFSPCVNNLITELFESQR